MLDSGAELGAGFVSLVSERLRESVEAVADLVEGVDPAVCRPQLHHLLVSIFGHRNERSLRVQIRVQALGALCPLLEICYIKSEPHKLRYLRSVHGRTQDLAYGLEGT